jgi:hypothetical protein
MQQEAKRIFWYELFNPDELLLRRTLVLIHTIQQF